MRLEQEFLASASVTATCPLSASNFKSTHHSELVQLHSTPGVPKSADTVADIQHV